MVVFHSPLPAQTQVSAAFNETTRLAGLAKVWGFLKYYHPNVARGYWDWDDVLIDTIESVKAAETKEAFHDAIIEMIQRAGGVNFLGYIHIMPDDTPEEPGFQWMEDTTLFNWYITIQLKSIKQHHPLIDNVYVKYYPYVGNVNLEDENSYTDMIYPNENWRLLALFRYWNVIQYFFPYKYLIGCDWEDVLAEMIPIFEEASDAAEYHLAACQLAARINDSHAYTNSSVLTEYWGNYYPPFKTSTIQGQTVVTFVYTGLIEDPEAVKPGDIIQRVEGTPVETIKQRLYKYMWASNESVKERNLNQYIFRGNIDHFTLTLLRDSQEQAVQVKRYLKDVLNEQDQLIDKGPIWKILEGNIGYVDMGRLEIAHVNDAMEELTETRAIIFDIRNYPHNTLFDIADHLNPLLCPFVKFSKPVQSAPGKFYYTDDRYCGPYYYNENYYKGKVILLFNEITQSHAEFTCMALQTAPDVTCFGSQTAGADGNVSYIILPGGIITCFSGIGVYYPDGRETQRIGIVPDIEVKPTIQGIREGRDEVLEKALEYINNSM